jgi:hypothetical protein
MSEHEKDAQIKEYADGWITERKGTDVPGFLKLAFPIIGLGAVAYFILYINGEVTHDERGPLVRMFNQATSSADGFMYLVAAMALVFVVIVVAFAARKTHEE